MSLPEHDELIDYLLGRLSPADAEALEERMRSDAELAQTCEELRRELDAVDAERWGMKTFVMEIDAAGKTSTGDPFILYQRQLVVFGSFGAYCFTITSSDKATLDKAEEELIASVTWKK